ncbi:MAG: Fic family protein [Proteobacteria bacterium]|nr:Fic family protein [Pseudomonadota bacterium]
MNKKYKPPYTITTKMVNLIAAISEELTWLEFNKKQIITPQLRKKNRIKTLAGTLEIEGNFLGEEKITAIINGKTVLGTILEVAEVNGAINCYKELGKYQFDEMDSLLYAHKILMHEILTTAGAFRTIEVGVGHHVAPPSHRVSGLMTDLFSWLKNCDEHPLITSSVFHFEFEFIHPFSDGNGRIGRLWQTVILYNWKKIFNVIPTESIIRDHQQKYYDALEKSGALGESTPFIEFMLDIILKTIKQQKPSKNNVLLNVPNNVPNNVPLKRLNKILQLMAKNKQITIVQLAAILQVTDKTINRDIAKLKSSHKIIRLGSLKTGHWELVD